MNSFLWIVDMVKRIGDTVSELLSAHPEGRRASGPRLQAEAVGAGASVARARPI